MKILSIVAIATFVFAGAARAEDVNVTDPKVAPATSPLTEQNVQVGAKAQVFGKVIGLHNCNMVGMKDPHVLVKLESAPGDVEIVDLGSIMELKASGIEPREGQQLWVDGKVGKINDKLLVVAEIISESKLVMVSRHAPLTEETTKHADSRNAEAGASATAADSKDPKAPKTETVDAGQQAITIEGTVLHTRHLKIEGQADEHMFAKIQTASGIAVLDLGSCDKVPKTVDLSEGKAIAASGVVGHVNGKPIILADSVGNLSNIQRAAVAEIAPVK